MNTSRFNFLPAKVSFFFALVGCALVAGELHGQANTANGLWLNEEKDGKILIYACGEKLCGKLVEMNEPNDPTGKPKLDSQNPDPALRSRPILSMILMKNFTYDGGNRWSGGSIYDGRSGKTYSCKMTLVGPSQLEVRGYIGISLFGKTTTWTRVK